MLLTEGQMSDYKGAALMLEALPPAKELIGDKGDDGGCLRNALAARDTAPRIPSKRNRKVATPHNAVLYRQHHKIENMLRRLEDWHRIQTRYNRCTHAFSRPSALRNSDLLVA